MQISILLGPDGQTSSFQNPCTLHLYKKEKEEWISKTTIPIDLHEHMDNPREYLKSIGEQISPCKNIVCLRMIGIAYQIFDFMGFDIWEVEGHPNDFLDKIIEEMNNEEDESLSADSFIIHSDSKIILDLINLQKIDPNQTSKQIIQPILKDLNTKTLELICAHIPPWLLQMEKKNILQIKILNDDGKICACITKI